MGPIDYRVDIMRLVSEEDREGKHEMGDLDTRVKRISSTLQQDMDAGNDLDTMKLVWTFVETHKEPVVQNLRRDLIFNSSCKIETLTISKQELEELGDHLWEKHGMKKLIIEQDGKTTEYGPRVLRQFMKMKAPIDALTEEYTLIFNDDEELFETKANLLLCGEYFQTLFGAGMEESKSGKIDLSKVAFPFVEREGKMISLKQLGEEEIDPNEIQEIVLNKDILDDILQEVKTGNRDMEDDVYAIVCDNLQYSKWTGIPEGVFGPTQWEEYYGLKLDDVPEVPENILARLEALQKKGKQEKEKLVLIPKGVSLDSMEELAKNPKSGNSAKYDYYWSKIKEKHGKERVEHSRWVLISTEVLPESRGKRSREEQLKMAREYEKGYQAPTLLEAVILNFVTHAATGKCLFGRGNLWTYTVCQEDPIDGWKLVVGGFAPAGLGVNDGNVGSGRVGVAPVLREF